MIENLVKMFPEIIISGYHCPEFMTADELVFNNKETIKELDADIIWVSLGFPNKNCSLINFIIR
ncbi:MAG: hypothetical protein CM15mP11_10000 [Gammaproteobacteria bacterium]|nr:MAG: hypothetical protein CM15mP11_10000 [Gammaproteobacteria bacterium]